MTWLVTGGAGYIGAHVVRALDEADMSPVVIDDLSTGIRDFVAPDIPFVQGTILDGGLLERAMEEHAVTGVIHLAGFKYAGVSVRRPLHTYEQNITGTARLLEAMGNRGVERLVFSSSASVYGTPDESLVTESSRLHPESPYGETKLAGEWLIADVGRCDDLLHTSLRYFNVVGSGPVDLYDTSPHNLFPLVFETLLADRVPRINGDDYPTRDGTCVRDYVHVSDVAAAHVAAARRLGDGERLEAAYNLGSGHGSSVREIMDAICEVTEISFDPTIEDRRPGDPATIVASGELAARDLGWSMRHTIEDMVRSAWQARVSAA